MEFLNAMHYRDIYNYIYVIHYKLLPSMKSSSVCARFCIRPRQFFVFDVAANVVAVVDVVVLVVVGIAVALVLQLALNVIRFNSIGFSGCVAVSAWSSTTIDFSIWFLFLIAHKWVVKACKWIVSTHVNLVQTDAMFDLKFYKLLIWYYFIWTKQRQWSGQMQEKKKKKNTYT